MRNISFIVFIFLAIMCGCSKSGSNSTNDYYNITGISDITVRQYTDTSIPIVYHIVFPAGIYEPVTMNISGLPPGATATPNTGTDTTSFSVTVTYHVLMNAAASFPVNITLFSASFGTKSFLFNIVITPNAPFSYTITSLHDISVPLYADTTLQLIVSAVHSSGANEPVTTTADGLPAGVSVTPAAIMATPPFQDTFAFHIIASATGIFPVTIHSTSSQGTKTATFNINVNGAQDCAPQLIGNYFCNTVCTSYSGSGTGVSSAQVYTDGAGKLLIHFPLANMITDLNCSTGTFNAEPVTSGIYVIPDGTGTFDANSILINYTLAGSINSACTTTLTR